MEGISAGLAYCIYNGPVTAELGAIGIGENGELRNGLNTQRCAHHARSGAVVPKTLNVSAVQEISLAFRSRAGNAEVVLRTIKQIRPTVTNLGTRRYSWYQRHEIREVAAIERQVVDLLLLYKRRHRRRNGVDL